jgi:prepilin-type processing-associated H-X9-DG protein/prepilin-type N-terminal cleavage/methylation domain-containing protein
VKREFGVQGQRFHAARWGFTLMELLVVLAIMVILAALLFPVFVQARAMAYRATCSQHLKQIAQAGMMYLQDYDDRFPSCYKSDAPPFSIDPRTTLQPYLRNWSVLYCPERQTILDECLDPINEFQPRSRCMGYGYNWGSDLKWNAVGGKADGLVRPISNGTTVAIGVCMAEVAAPARCFFYGDTNDYEFVTLLRLAMPGVRSDTPNAEGKNPLGMAFEPPRHSGGNNFAFVDGHVQWLRFPGGHWLDGGPWVVPDMSMYSRTGRWETRAVP